MDNREIAKSIMEIAKAIASDEPKTETVSIRQAAEECSHCAKIMKIHGKRRMSREAFDKLRDRLAAKGDKCGEKGCIRKVKGGYAIMSGKTGKFWRGTKGDGKPGKIRVYKTEKEAEDVLKRYHGWGFKASSERSRSAAVNEKDLVRDAVQYIMDNDWTTSEPDWERQVIKNMKVKRSFRGNDTVFHVESEFDPGDDFTGINEVTFQIILRDLTEE